MTVEQALQKTQAVSIAKNPLPVEVTSAHELLSLLPAGTEVWRKADTGQEQPVFKLAVASNAPFDISDVIANAPHDDHWAYFRIAAGGNAELVVSHPALLYAYTTRLLEDWHHLPVSSFEKGKYFTAAFRWHRPLYDYLLTQVWRTARNYDPEQHIRELARNGYTHVEVNGLAMPVPFEDAIAGEFYSQFYSYCIALDQYVYSELNKGIYPVDYLTANLNLLKRYAALGRKYGLQPGLLCFEPRTVPETLLEKYPTLRGARVDHPFRSRKPRYTLTHAHPLVQQHYREMLQKLLKEVPDLAYMSIWSNDSGSGFEYTSSLYVGRNGGPYLIREWRTHEQIAEVAGKNVVHFMQLLRDAASETNPDFRVSLRLEPFKVEHDVIMENLDDRLDIEVPSLLVRGYDLPYHHDKYPDIPGVAGSLQHIHLDSQEKKLAAANEKEGIASHLIYSHANGFNFEPLLGIPFPWMLWQKLQEMKNNGIKYAANLGGFTASRLAPYHINQEVFRAFMLDAEAAVDDIVQQKAEAWTDSSTAKHLVAIWQQTEHAVRWLPPLYLYSNFGFVWLRVWVRPIIPDLHAVPEQDRRYYEDYLVSSSNNTNLVDLGRDVLFELITKEYGQLFVERVDENVLPKLNAAIEIAAQQADLDSNPPETRRCMSDQRDRLLALRCWISTLRSVAGWVAGVYNYLEADGDSEKKQWRNYLDDMMSKEIENAKNLLQLWQTSETHFMAVSGHGETSYIYGENLGELIARKIKLMEDYRHVEPRIDKDIMWKV